MIKRFLILLALVPSLAFAQTVGTYTEQNGAVKNTVGVEAVGPAIGSTTSGQTGPLVQCAVTASAPTYVTGKTDPLSCSTAGALRVGGAVTVTGAVSATGLEYETVAASQTAQVMGATGATGDLISHCILQPTTTAPGTMTVLDNATVIFTFTTTTLSALQPIVVPLNATSVSGAWKITTGANETVTCFGDFT